MSGLVVGQIDTFIPQIDHSHSVSVHSQRHFSENLRMLEIAIVLVYNINQCRMRENHSVNLQLLRMLRNAGRCFNYESTYVRRKKRVTLIAHRPS